MCAPPPAFIPAPIPASAPPPARRGCLLCAASSGRLSPRGTPLPRRSIPPRARSPFPAPAPLSAASAPHRLARRVPVLAAALPGSLGRDHGGGRGRRADETATHAGKERGGRGPQTKAAARRGLAGAGGGLRVPPPAFVWLGGDRGGRPSRSPPADSSPEDARARRSARSLAAPSSAAWTPPSSGPGGCSSCAGRAAASDRTVGASARWSVGSQAREKDRVPVPPPGPIARERTASPAPQTLLSQ